VIAVIPPRQAKIGLASGPGRNAIAVIGKGKTYHGDTEKAKPFTTEDTEEHRDFKNANHEIRKS